MFAEHPHSRSALALAFTPLPATTSNLHPPVGSQIPVYGTTPSRSPVVPSPRSRSRASSSSGSPTPKPRTRTVQTRVRASSNTHLPPYSHFAFSSYMSQLQSPGSPPPYSPTPPEINTSSSFLSRRAASSPHLHSPPSSPAALHSYPYSGSNSRIPSSSNLNGPRSRFVYPSERSETSDDPDTDTSPEDTVIYTSTHPSLTGTLRARIFGTVKGRADEGRSITTAPGVIGAGETETEGEESPRNLPTARITPPSTSIPLFSTLASTATTHLLDPPRALIPTLFELSRLLSIVPAVFGTLYNLYHVLFPPGGLNWWRVDYFLCVLWSILTGWQCLQLTTGLLKRWRVYYTPLPTLIRLLALQAICWPATHFTLTILQHDKRPLICWAAIGTTTCCSRSIQMWVTSNIIVTSPSHHHHNHHYHHHNHTPSSLTPTPSSTCVSSSLRRDSTQTLNSNANAEKERMKMGKRRKWDWAAVGRYCVLPAGILYFIMAWVELLRREWEAKGC